MATQVQFRRGTTSQNNAFTGAQGELTIDTDVYTIRIHDGTTAGGRQVPTLTATQTFTNKTMGSSSVWNGNAIGLGYGGTGAALTGVAGAIVYTTGSAMALSLAGTSGQVLTSGGTSGPTWVSASSLSTGTATTATTATNIAGGSAGYLVYQQDTNTTAFIAPGDSGFVLRSTGASTAPGWVTSTITLGTTATQVGDTSTSIAGIRSITMGNGSHGGATVGTITGTGPWTATLTGISSTTGIQVGQNITATAGTGSLFGGSPTSVLVASIVSGTSITVTVTGGTTPTAGTITSLTTLGFLQVPTGTTAQRPWVPANGMIRYNSTQSTFEGYSSSAWSSLGGVKSVDGYTYIQAETSAGASNGDLDFYAEDSAGTAATQIGQWNRTNLKDYTGTLVGTQTTQNVFNATATTVNAFGASTATTLGATTGTHTIRNATVSLPNATAITTGQTTVALLNTTATTVNAFGAATALNLGAATGTLTVANTTLAAKAITASTTLTVTGATVLNGGLTMDSTAFTVADTTGNTAIAGTLNVTGTTTLGNLTIGSTKTIDVGANKVTNVAEPTAATDAATKQYVDTIAASSLHYHLPVRVESPTALNATYANGTAGVGATLTNAGTQAALVLDGISLSLNDRVLIYTQANAAHNGVYTVTTVGSGSVNWVLTRATDADNAAVGDPTGLGSGDAFYVKEGTTGAGELYVMNTTGTITVGTTAINFVQISSAQIYSAGTGLTLTGTQYSVNASQTQVTAVGTLTSGTWNASVIGPIYGGTGVNNGTSTLTMAGSVTHSGAFTQSFAATGNTSVTLPTTGTLATLAGTETFTNKTLTSPTLTTPVLGTPSSGTLTSCTGLPISTGVSGLGTGVATFLATPSSANLISAITDETGSGALVFGTAPTMTLPTVNNIRNGYNTTATAAGTTTLTVNSNYAQFFTGTTTQIVTLPAPQTMTLGMSYLLVNNSTGNIEVRASNAAVVVNLIAGTAVQVTSIDLTAGNGAAGWNAEFVGFSGVTGTGNVVLATSPTLVTPALGTPASGTLTSCTGLPISTGVSGLGTGAATFLATPSSANLAAMLTDETGTGANVFANTPTLVTPVLGAATGTSIVLSAGAQSASLGVGTAASGTTGEIRATNAITSYYSDDRLKTKTGNIQNALEKVLSLDGFHYHANETAVALGYDASKQEIGLSAQQVQAVLPEVIAPAPIDPQYMTMHYERLVPLLVEAIKEQQKQIEELKAKLGN
jgi:hypothetical protein